MGQQAMTLAELAEAAGLPARTIRFYIARGLVWGPEKAGRGAVYGAQHLERLERIARLQAEGRMLAEIARLLEPGPDTPVPEPAAWWQYAVSGDVQVWVRAGSAPWRMKRIQTAVAEMTKALGTEGEDEQ